MLSPRTAPADLTAEPCGAPDACPSPTRHRQQLVELERRVATDCLTGLWNRTHFERMIESELEEASIKMEKETVDFLRTWLTDHIAEEDRAFGRYLANPA